MLNNKKIPCVSRLSAKFKLKHKKERQIWQCEQKFVKQKSLIF